LPSSRRLRAEGAQTPKAVRNSKQAADLISYLMNLADDLQQWLPRKPFSDGSLA
jgi:hypothetical protein